MLFGIALIDSLPFRITCDVSLRPGRGEIILSGPIDLSIEEVINHGIQFANVISDFESIPFPNLANHNLHIRMRLPLHPAPIRGPSCGLLLVLNLIGALLRRHTTRQIAVTGEVDGLGAVHSVGAIEEKRKAAAEFGCDAIILPASQLDFFSTTIAQIPVSTIFEAYTAAYYGETERSQYVRA